MNDTTMTPAEEHEFYGKPATRSPEVHPDDARTR